MLLRLQLAYWFICSEKLKRDKPSIDLHVHAFTNMSLILFAFVYGCWSLILLFFDLHPVFGPYISVAILAFLAVGGVYASLINGKRYLQGKRFIESVGDNEAKSVCIRNGLLLVVIGILPQTLALIYMASF